MWTSYPDLFIVFDGTSTFPVEAKAHEVDTQNTGQGFNARPFHRGPLCRETNAHNSLVHNTGVIK